MSELLKKITSAYPLHSFLMGLYFTLYGINQYETLFVEGKDVLILFGVTTLLSAVVYFGILFLVKTFFHPPAPSKGGDRNELVLSKEENEEELSAKEGDGGGLYSEEKNIAAGSFSHSEKSPPLEGGRGVEKRNNPSSFGGKRTIFSPFGGGWGVEKTAILTTTILIFILFYFHFYLNVLKIDGFQFLRSHSYFLLLMLLLIGGWTFYLFKSKKTFAILHQYLNTLMLVLLLFECGKIAWNYYQTQQWYPAIREEFIAYEGQDYVENDSEKPSVYHILMDSYTGTDALQKYWNFDNAELTNHLTSKGFYVAQHAQGNYFHTRQVVPAMMNRDYFWNFEEGGKETAPAYLIALTGIRNARTFRDFEAMGYEMINLSVFDMLDLPAHREYSGIPETSFLGFMLRKTVLDVYFEKKRDWTHHEAAIEILEEMKTISQRTDTPPVYVYAHLMIPHYPYFFDREGNIQKGREAEKHWSNKEHYLDQLIYTNKLLINTIDEILHSSEVPPIIILHGDHGFRFLEGEAKDEAAYSILAAFYFPKKNYTQLHDSISPVNFYRATLNANFDTDFPLLKDEKERYR